jgi:signal transduction histidine kinase
MTTILLVEDDVHLMEGIREILELDNNYQVVTANNGLDGLERLNSMESPPDLIVSDIMMPKMDGYQFFEAVRSEAAWLSIPFIFLTAKGEKADIRLGKSLGADDYVTKPFSAEDLLVAVSAKLARHDQLQSAFLVQISEMKRRILTILNHEFRTPLTYVVAYADMLNRDVDKMELDELREYLKGVNSGADRLRRLVENFIFLVELETGEVASTYAWRKKPIKSFEKIITLATRPQQSVLESMGQVLRVEAKSPQPISGDEEYLAIALARLIDNASKFSAKNAIIELHLYSNAEGQTIFAVRDFGRGIPENELERIFEPFYQINRQKYEDQGAGSGLAIVRGVANVHGAEIRVESTLGSGSTFYLHFPSVAD